MKLVTRSLFGFFAMFYSFACFAVAASVLDSTTTTAISDGFGNLQATILDLLSLAWPFLIAVGVILMTPRIVKKLIGLIAK
ncbi:MAG: hypothetical protein LBU43_02395 [Candidatus Accumulibacter sp.]|jgi:hypothetical protein|nr:hypothetical protein [Accumulibacter sp.]